MTLECKRKNTFFFSFSSSVSPLVHAELCGFRSSSQYHLKQTPRTASNVSKMTFYFPACHRMIPGPQLTFRMVLPFRPTRWSLSLFTSPAPSPPHPIFVFCSPLHTWTSCRCWNVHSVGLGTSYFPRMFLHLFHVYSFCRLQFRCCCLKKGLPSCSPPCKWCALPMCFRSIFTFI